MALELLRPYRRLFTAPGSAAFTAAACWPAYRSGCPG